MNFLPTKLVALLLFAFAFVLTGCNGISNMTDEQRYHAVSATYQVKGKVVVGLLQNGVIKDPDTIKDILKIDKEIKTELDAMGDALINNVPLDFQYFIFRVNGLLGRLIQHELDAKKLEQERELDNAPTSAIDRGSEPYFDCRHDRIRLADCLDHQEGIKREPREPDRRRECSGACRPARNHAAERGSTPAGTASGARSPQAA